MKSRLTIGIVLSLGIALCGTKALCDLPTAEEVNKLAAAAWKKPLQSIDVSLYKDIAHPAKSVEEIREMIEGFFNKAEGPKANLSPQELDMRNRNIQLNVERTLKEQEAGRRVKQRVRIWGQRQRIDQVNAQPRMVLMPGTPSQHTLGPITVGPNTPYETSFVNTIDKKSGLFMSFAYYHASKKLQVTSKEKTTWKRNDVIELAQLATPFQALLGLNKGSVAEPVFVPDPDKMEQLRKTGLVAAKLRLTIKPDPDYPDDRDYIQLKSDDCPCGSVFVCEKADYSRVYYMETCNPITGHPLYIRECSNFDSQGFPHNATVIQYDLSGKLKKKKVYTIERVELNPSIPDELFEFKPPEGYEVIDLRPGAAYLERSKRASQALEMLKKLRSVSDLPHLRNLLKHESWRVRLMALKTISTLPIEDPEVRYSQLSRPKS